MLLVLLVLLLVRVSFARTVSCFVLIKYYLSRTQVRMRRVSISYGFSKLWCVCSFLRSFVRSFVRSFAMCLFVCLFVCLFLCVLKNVVVVQRKEEKAPPRPFNCIKKKACGEEKVVLLFFGRSRSLGCLRLNARGRSDYFLGRLAHGGVRGGRPGTRRPRTHGGTTRLFVALSSSSFCVETTHHPSIDRCRLALLDTARVRA